MKYRQKEQTVTAKQWKAKKPLDLGSFFDTDERDALCTYIKTGRKEVEPVFVGDWIVTFDNGEKKMVPDKEFRREYEEIS